MMRSLYIIAGEVSGDQYATQVARQLQQQVAAIELLGLGGEQLAATSDKVENWLDKSSIMGFVEVVKNARFFYRKLQQTVTDIIEIQPDAVLLVDYPGFNVRLAQALRKKGYSKAIFYYISPKVWSWHRKRIYTLQRVVDYMLVIFPFEEVLYEQVGLPVKFVGNPLCYQLQQLPLKTRDMHRVGLLPGSRRREINDILPVLLDCAEQLKKQDSKLVFEIPVARSNLQPLIEQQVKARAMTDYVKIGEKSSIATLQTVQVAIIASGTATLEAAILGCPHVLTYRVSSWNYWIAKYILKIGFIGLINILANKLLVPELIQQKANAQQINEEITKLLYDSSYRQQVQQPINAVVETLGSKQSDREVATAIIQFLQ